MLSSSFRVPLTELNHSVRDTFFAGKVIPVLMDISDKIVVPDFGRKIADGTPQVVRADEAIIAAYLGTDRDAAVEVEAAAAV